MMNHRNRRKVWWKPTEGHKKLDPVTWKIFCQENTEILPGKSVLITIPFGIEMSEGVTMVSLDEKLKRLKCGIQNETIIEDTPDISIIVQNYSEEIVSIQAGQALCLLRYV